jgi:hypothetical protein
VAKQKLYNRQVFATDLIVHFPIGGFCQVSKMWKFPQLTSNPLDFFGRDAPVVLRVIEYGFKHPEFTKADIQAAAEVDDATWHRYWQHLKMVVELGDGYFCLTTEAVGIYLQIISFQHAERQARRANCLATVAIIVALIALASTLLVA